MVTTGSSSLRALSSRTQNRLRQIEIARILGTTQISVSRWQSGKRRPNAAMRERIFRAFGIDPKAWLTPAEVEELLCVNRSEAA